MHRNCLYTWEYLQTKYELVLASHIPELIDIFLDFFKLLGISYPAVSLFGHTVRKKGVNCKQNIWNSFNLISVRNQCKNEIFYLGSIRL